VYIEYQDELVIRAFKRKIYP